MFGGLFVVLGLIVVGYILWMIRAERRDGGRGE